MWTELVQLNLFQTPTVLEESKSTLTWKSSCWWGSLKLKHTFRYQEGSLLSLMCKFRWWDISQLIFKRWILFLPGNLQCGITVVPVFSSRTWRNCIVGWKDLQIFLPTTRHRTKQASKRYYIGMTHIFWTVSPCSSDLTEGWNVFDFLLISPWCRLSWSTPKTNGNKQNLTWFDTFGVHEFNQQRLSLNWTKLCVLKLPGDVDDYGRKWPAPCSFPFLQEMTHYHKLALRTSTFQVIWQFVTSNNLVLIFEMNISSVL